jgi:hypothetical protein
VFVLLRGLVLTLFSVFCIGVLYVAVIMGETPEAQGDTEGWASATPLPAALALPGGMRSLESADLAQLAAMLPARLATLPAQQGFVLIQGKVEDVRLAGVTKTCRVVTLTYQHPALRAEVSVYSAVPRGYIQRFAQQDFVLSPAMATMGTLPAMALNVEDRRVYVAAQGEAVYAVEGLASVQGLENVPGWVTLIGGGPTLVGGE